MAIVLGKNTSCVAYSNCDQPETRINTGFEKNFAINPKEVIPTGDKQSSGQQQRLSSTTKQTLLGELSC